MRVRLASFFAGAATASFAGLYILHKDYKVAHQSFTQQVNTRINFPFIIIIILVFSNILPNDLCWILCFCCPNYVICESY